MYERNLLQWWKQNAAFQLILQVFQSEFAVWRVMECETSVVAVGGKAFTLTKNDGKVDAQGIQELISNQEEGNTLVILYLKDAAQKGLNYL